MAVKPQVGDRIINEHGTCLEVVDVAEGIDVEPGAVPEHRLDEFLEAGYRKLKDGDEVPVQVHEL